MKTDALDKAQSKLDPTKLFGFRNLVPVASTVSDIREVADLAFTKRGIESVA